ncbi:Hypothetical predicted protein [Olea europaea subsp. europaea]|uniref:Uncharacterized protein n=1 Tax=Olea europaea subsp. europaea TaxID=158383 RepID=A0A8S0Q2L2_OLEEU|nr:Hypothetical predicted protein [Olea europaea subsp. europaea]
MGDGGMADSDDDKTSESKIPTFEDIREITIRRSKLAKMEKKTATWVPLNVAAEKDRLRRELEVAEMRDDERKDSEAIRLAEMNKSNRVENLKNASEYKYYYLSNSGGEAAASDAIAVLEIANSNGGEVSAEAGMAATAAADAGKLVDTRPPVDQGTVTNLLHNFELHISLSLLQKFGWPKLDLWPGNNGWKRR